MRYKLSPLSIRETSSGAAISGATVTVYLAGTTTLATCYADTTTGTPLTGSNTTTTSSGYFEFFIDPKDYRATQKFKIVISKTEYANVTYDNLSILQEVHGSIDVKEFGAVGDGTTNDTSAINSALAISGDIFFPPGTYLVTGDTLVGSSDQALHFAPGAILKLDRTGSSKTILAYTSKNRVKLYNPTFDVNQNGSISDIALKINGSTNVKIFNPRIYNSGITRNWPSTAAYGYGIYLLGAYENVTIKNIHAYDCMYPIITEPSSTGKGLTVSKGLVEYISRDGVEINVPTGSCEDFEVEGVKFYKCGSNSASGGFGVGTSGGSGTTVKKGHIHDNKFIQCDFAGVHVEDGCERVNIHDNEFEDCGAGSGTSGLGSAIYVAVTNGSKLSKKIKIHDNGIKATTGSDYGIYCGGSQFTDDCEVKDNIVNMNGVGKGIHVGSMFRRSKINDNTVKNSNGVGMTVSAPYSQVRGNICYDDLSSTQTYGIEYTNGADYTVFAENTLIGNVTGSFLETSVPDGARFLDNIEAEDQLVKRSVTSSTANTVGSYTHDGPVAYPQQRDVNDEAYAMTRYDRLIVYTALSAGRQVTLPDTNLQVGHEVIIKDGAGAAGTHNITVASAANIDGVGSKVINTNGGFLRCHWTGSTWLTV